MSCNINVGSAVASGHNSTALLIKVGNPVDNEKLKAQLKEEFGSAARVNAFSAVASGNNSSATIVTMESSRPDAILQKKTKESIVVRDEDEGDDYDEGDIYDIEEEDDEEETADEEMTLNYDSAVANKPYTVVTCIPDGPIDPSAQALMERLTKTWT